MFFIKIKKHRLLINCLIIFSFLFLSSISVILIWYNNKIFFTGDSPFHTARLSELLRSNILFPRFALNSFESAGSAVMTVYPYLFLYPIVILFHITGSIKTSLYITFVIGTFSSLLISYYSSLKFSKNVTISYLFALIYSLSYEFTNMYFTSSVIGVYWSSIFLVLVVFGFIYYLKYNKWLMLSIGMSLLLCTSMITFAFMAVLLLLWLLINYKLIDKTKFITLFRAVLLTCLTTAFIWVPLLSIISCNKFRILSLSKINTIGISHIIYYSIIPSLKAPAQSLTLYSFLGIIVGAIFLKKLPHFIKQVYIISILFILLSSRLFPWVSLSHISIFKNIKDLQSTGRMLVLPQVLLELILSICIVKYLPLIIKNKRNRKICLIIIAMFMVFMQLSGQVFSWQSKGINKQITNKSLLNSDLANYDPGYNNDYFPSVMSNTTMTNISHHNGLYKNSKIHFVSNGNGKFVFNNHKYITKLNMPFIFYKNVKYKDYLDYKFIKVSSNKNRAMVIKNVNPGKHYIRISIPLSKGTIIARSVSSLSLLIYVAIIYDKFNKVRLYR